jgi:hypothetical protein
MSFERSGKVPTAVAVGAVATTVAALLLSGSVGLTSSAPAEAGRGYVSTAHGFSVALPPGWRRAQARLVPNLLDPREILSAGTFPMPVGGGGNCGSEPVAAVRRMQAGDALISIQEVGADRSGRSRLLRSFDPRPARFDLHSLYSPAGRFQLSALEEKPRVGFARLAFRDRGRAFYAMAYVKGPATRALRSQVGALLASLRFRSR